MTYEGLNSMFLQYQRDEVMSGSQFTLPPDLTAALGWHGDESAAQRSQRGPRGGKKPLRPRQQQLNTLEAELEKKSRDLKAAQAEHERLQQRIKVLEVVLPVREQQVQLLKQRRQATQVHSSAHVCTQDAAQHADAVRITELRPSASSGGFSSGSESGQSSDDVIAFGSGPALRAAACQQPAALTRAIQSSADYAKVISHADTYTNGHVALFTSIPAHNHVPCQVLRQASAHWKQWVREAGLVLHAYDARPHDPGPQLKIAQLYEQIGLAFSSLRLEYPSFLSELLYINLETGEREEPPPDSYWIPVAQGMRLSPAQVADAKAALALYKERAAKALDDRRRLATKLDSHLASLQMRAPQQGSGAGQLDGPEKCGQLVLEVDEVAGQLYRNVMVQGDAMETVKDFCCSIFSLVQMVRASVVAYPYFPDTIAVLSSLDTISPGTDTQQ